MTRLRWLIAITSISAFALAGVGAFVAAASASWGPTRGGTSSSGREKITMEKYKGGKILANAKGFTVYAFTRDKPNKDKCVAIKDCKRFWPLVTTKGKPIAGTGVKQSLLGTINVPGVGEQVTYNRHPLYTYTGDSRPHQTFYVNFLMFGGRWPGVNAEGKAVR
jgi:predicted lipoprotein with Yx(FWY)xxD motif